MAEQTEMQGCESCGAVNRRSYQFISFANLEAADRLTHDEREIALCTSCARKERKRMSSEPHPAAGLTRQELLAELDRFFAASGVFEICGRCHQQGTGCCPPTCRVMGAAGCDPANKYGKTVFCAAFLCGALLNAIAECDAELARTLRWIKTELGPAEFRVYQMITRVPKSAREEVRPLTLPARYPHLTGLTNGEKLRENLLALTAEILEIRRRWHAQERLEQRSS